jgi:hypothetical protein
VAQIISGLGYYSQDPGSTIPGLIPGLFDCDHDMSGHGEIFRHVKVYRFLVVSSCDHG